MRGTEAEIALEVPSGFCIMIPTSRYSAIYAIRMGAGNSTIIGQTKSCNMCLMRVVHVDPDAIRLKLAL